MSAKDTPSRPVFVQGARGVRVGEGIRVARGENVVGGEGVRLRGWGPDPGPEDLFPGKDRGSREGRG